MEKFLDNNKQLKKYVIPKFRTFRKFVDKLTPSLYMSEDDYFWVKDFEPQNTSILGLNSCWASENSNDKNNITLGYPQVMSALEKALYSNRIVLMHHPPFNWLNDLEFKRYEDEIFEECSLILHGHTHSDCALVVRTPSASCICLGANASYTRDKDGFIGFQFIEVDFKKANTEVKVWPYRLDGRQGVRFIPDTHRWKQDEGKDFFRVSTSSEPPPQTEKSEKEQSTIGIKPVGFELKKCIGASIDNINHSYLKTVINSMDERRIVECFGESLSGNDDPMSLLKQTGLLKDGQLSNAAVLLYGKKPQTLPGLKLCSVFCTRFKGTKETSEVLDDIIITGTLDDQIRSTIDFVKKNIRKGWEIGDDAKRQESYEYPLEAFREIVTNAVAHRDYELEARSQVRIYDDRIEVRNPGNLVESLSVDNLLNSHNSYPRNKFIASHLYASLLVEERGMGTIKVGESMMKAGLRLPVFSNSGRDFVVTLFGPGDQWREKESDKALPESTKLTGAGHHRMEFDEGFSKLESWTGDVPDFVSMPRQLALIRSEAITLKKKSAKILLDKSEKSFEDLERAIRILDEIKVEVPGDLDTDNMLTDAKLIRSHFLNRKGQIADLEQNGQFAEAIKVLKDLFAMGFAEYDGRNIYEVQRQLENKAKEIAGKKAANYLEKAKQALKNEKNPQLSMRYINMGLDLLWTSKDQRETFEELKLNVQQELDRFKAMEKEVEKAVQMIVRREYKASIAKLEYVLTVFPHYREAKDYLEVAHKRLRTLIIKNAENTIIRVGNSFSVRNFQKSRETLLRTLEDLTLEGDDIEALRGKCRSILLKISKMEETEKLVLDTITRAKQAIKENAPDIAQLEINKLDKNLHVRPEILRIKIQLTEMKKNENALAKVIREIPSNQLNKIRSDFKPQSQKIVIYDPKAKEVIKNTSFLTFKRQYKYFLVSYLDDAHGETEYDITSSTFPIPITINISYDARCELEKEEILVKSLCSDSSVTDTLNIIFKQFIQTYIENLKRNGIKPEAEFTGYKDKLTEALKRYLSNHVGLHADINLSIKGYDVLECLTINLEPFSIRVLDYSAPLSLQVDAGMDIDNSNRSAAINLISRQDNLNEFIISQIKRYLAKNVNLHQFVYGLQTTVKNDLMEMLARELVPKGRKIAWMQLNSYINFEIPPKNVNMYFSVLCDISDYSQKIEVEHKLLLQLDDLGKFKNNCGGLGLEEWVEDQLNTITKGEMFTQRYVDILMDFDQDDPQKQDILNRIKQKMQRQVNTVGYTMKHLIVQPNMKPMLIKKNGFMLNLQGEEFATRISRMNVNLDIVVTGKIHDLRKLHAYIAPDKDIEKEMERVVRMEIEKQMHYVDPQEYYMPFKCSDGKNVEEKLKTHVARVMEELFYAHDIKIILKTRETVLIERILKLVNGSPYHINVDVLPLAGGGTQEYVKFEIEFLITAVDNWNVFVFKNFNPKTEEEIDKIKDCLQKDIKSKLMTIPYKSLKYSDVRGANTIKEIARLSHSKISAIFGLEINVTNVTRSKTLTETAMQGMLELRVEKEISIQKKILEEEVKAREAIAQAYEKVEDIEAKQLLTGEDDTPDLHLEPSENKGKCNSDNATDEFNDPELNNPDEKGCISSA